MGSRLMPRGFLALVPVLAVRALGDPPRREALLREPPLAEGGRVVAPPRARPASSGSWLSVKLKAENLASRCFKGKV